MRTSARPSADQTALLLSKAKIEDEEEPGRATAKKERKSRCTTGRRSAAREYTGSTQAFHSSCVVRSSEVAYSEPSS